VFESDLDNAGEPSFARYEDGDSLDRYISPELLAGTTSLCDSLDVPGVLPHHKPWWVSLVIGAHLSIRAGNSPQFGADRQLWDATKQAGKRPYVLESMDALRAFDAAPLAEQVTRLEFVVSHQDRAAEILERIQAAWRASDTSALAELLRWNLRLTPITFHKLIHDRNQQWLPQILGAIERRRFAFFAVGALHLAGENSLQRLLEEHGHTLVPYT
jgi:uncharacterized protein YbaP (TraB family)